MRDLKLIEATGIDLVELNESDLQWPSSKEALAILKDNLTRTARMIEAPLYSALTADTHRVAVYHILGEPAVDKYGGEDGKRIAQEMANMLNVGHENHRKNMLLCAENLNRFITHTNGIHPVFESLLNAMLVQAWTTFEVLVSDLHKRSRDHNIECFSHLAGTETFRFQKREQIRMSYKTAFLNDTAIQNKLNNQCVDALALIRNLIAHKGGHVDQAFIDACNDAGLTRWSSLPLRSQFEVDGEIIRDLINRNIQCLCRLIKAVDSWISLNKPKP